MNQSLYFFTNIGKQSFFPEYVGSGHCVLSFDPLPDIYYRIESLEHKKFIMTS